MYIVPKYENLDSVLTVALKNLANDRGSPRFIFLQLESSIPDKEQRINEVIYAISNSRWWGAFVSMIQEGHLGLNQEIRVGELVKPVSFKWFKHRSGQMMAICRAEDAPKDPTGLIPWPPIMATTMLVPGYTLM